MQKLSAKRSVIASKFITLDGRKFSLRDYPPFLDVYDKFNKQVLLFTARQVSKSTTLANLIILNSMRPHWRSLYIAPSQGQRNIFSNTRLGKVMRYSPLIDRHFSGGPDTIDQVGHKMWKNAAEIFLSYADNDPDRVRGISSNENYYDEVQDIDYHTVIPVVNETLSASPYGMRIHYSGTPKTMESAIQSLWEGSTQSEWVIKCSGCGRFNIAGLKNIGLNGPICAKCGKAINVRDGTWHDIVPGNLSVGRIKGYRIPQIILPLHTENPEKWGELRNKLEGPNAYSESKVKNEILAISDSLGKRMITLEDLAALCVEDHTLGTRSNSYTRTFAGIDWAGEGQTGPSHTAVWIWGVHQVTKRLRLAYYKIFGGGHPLSDVDEIASTIKEWGCDFIVGDQGGGAHANAMVGIAVGSNKLFQVKYGAFKQPFTWSAENNGYFADKTTVLDSFFLEVKKGHIFEFGPLELMRPAFEHFLSEYEEVTQDGEGRRVWRRSASKPDDALHAAVLAWLGFKVWADDLHFYT